jgi:hypothetical protein
MEIRVRFRRGDQWQSGRVRQLSTTSLSVATGCPPRKGDLLDIELSFDAIDLIATAWVVATTPPSMVDVFGAPGFGARFMALDSATTMGLEAICAASRIRGTSGARLAHRHDIRHPVRWPVLVGRGEDWRPHVALDLSRGGMFVRSDKPFDKNESVGLAIPLERRSVLMRAEARVARRLVGDTASELRIAPGFGLEVTYMSADDMHHYTSLVNRVSRRAGALIAIGASPPRLAELEPALTSAGYSAFCASDPDAIIERSRAHSLPPDLAIVDSSLADAARLERRLTTLGASTLRLRRETGDVARHRADALLLTERRAA